MTTPLPPYVQVNAQWQWSDPSLPAAYWWIDIGPFFDRFNNLGSPAIKAAILTATTPYCSAAYKDSMGRMYIDLKRPDLPGTLAGIGSEVAAFTPAIQAAILNTPTTNYERYIKGLSQPS